MHFFFGFSDVQSDRKLVQAVSRPTLIPLTGSPCPASSTRGMNPDFILLLLVPLCKMIQLCLVCMYHYLWCLYTIWTSSWGMQNCIWTRQNFAAFILSLVLTLDKMFHLNQNSLQNICCCLFNCLYLITVNGIQPCAVLESQDQICFSLIPLWSCLKIHISKNLISS